MAKICPGCGTYNAEQAKFCVKCGENLAMVNTAQPHSSPFQSPGQRQGGQCIYCGESRGFKEEEGRLDSKWGFTSHKFRFFICNNCGFSHMFAEGRSIFDFD